MFASQGEVIGLRNKTVIGSLLRLVLGVLAMVPAAVLTLWFLGEASRYGDVPVLLTELTVEAGTWRLSAASFRTDPEDPAPKFLRGISRRQLDTPGSYTVTLICADQEYEAVIHVVDTVAPTGQTVAVTSFGERPEPQTFVSAVEDVTDVTVSYETEPDLTKNGDQTVSLILTDTSGNTSRVEATLTVELDVTPPQIHGVQSFLVYQGDTVAYRAGVTVTDDRDSAPVLSVDASGVDLSRPGEYTVLYHAADASGNASSVETTVTVREKKPGYVSLELIYAEVDKTLDGILTDGMTKRQMARAIYDWVRRECVYVNHSDKSDYLQGAYVMLTERKGDCFNYFAVCKLMFERLGIETLDVRKVKNYPLDSDHYWLLVSLDGESFYHFDPVPRVGDTVEFFLVTDAFLDAYSEAHRSCFNRDKSLYPATP